MKIILTHSYKGGSGKTLFSINVANVLTSQFEKRVLLIESDFSMAAFQSIFKNYKPDMFFNDFLNSSEADLSSYIYPDLETNLGIVFCDSKFRARDKVHGSDQNWFLSKKRQLAKALSSLNYDYVIFDVTPGMHFFAINIISLANEVFLMARPDAQNIHGINILLDKIYSKSVQLNHETRSKLRIMFNQVPIISKIDPLLTEWKNQLTTKYSFIDSVSFFHYEPETGYNTAIEKFLLPPDDPTFLSIAKFVEEHY
ncbi:MAG: ParA family protein [Candidatus Kariarchaeaceae archaeon]